MTDQRFGKHERLKSRKAIQHLFDNGKSIKVFPLMMVYSFRESKEIGIKVGFSVSKKKFKRAVDRNKIKRIMRESFRLNKSQLDNTIHKENLSIDLMLIYLQNEIIPFDKLNGKMVDLMDKFLSNNENDHE